MDSHHVLVVAPEGTRGEEIATVLRERGHTVARAESGDEAAAALQEPGIDFLVLDLRSPDLSLAALRAALAPAGPGVPDTLDDAERRHITAVLRHTGGNKRQAALILGISRSTLLHKVRKYQVVIPRS